MQSDDLHAAKENVKHAAQDAAMAAPAVSWQESDYTDFRALGLIRSKGIPSYRHAAYAGHGQADDHDASHMQVCEAPVNPDKRALSMTSLSCLLERLFLIQDAYWLPKISEELRYPKLLHSKAQYSCNSRTPFCINLNRTA